MSWLLSSHSAHCRRWKAGRSIVVAGVVISAIAVVLRPLPASAGYGGGYGGTSGSGIWALSWWIGNPEGPSPYIGPSSGGADLCIWHDLGPNQGDLIGGLEEASLPSSFWDAPRGGGHEGIWGVLQWADTALASGHLGDHFDLVACPNSSEVPAGSGDVEDLVRVRPPGSRPYYLWLFWDTVPDPGSGPLPPVIDEAFDAVGLPSPTVESSPSQIDGTPHATVVNLETWLWVDDWFWHTWHATATSGQYSATVWATPVSVDWTAGWDFLSPTDDPQAATSLAPFELNLRCKGPGTPFNPAIVSADQSSNCEADFAQPTYGAVEPLKATVQWQVHWAYSNTSGVIGGEGTLNDVTTSATAPLRVMQVESVITSG